MLTLNEMQEAYLGGADVCETPLYIKVISKLRIDSLITILETETLMPMFSFLDLVRR